MNETVTIAAKAAETAPSTFDIVWAIVMLMLIGWLVLSMTWDAVSGAAAKSRNSWRESRNRELENEVWNLRRRHDDADWIRIDLRYEKSMREIAEDRARRAEGWANHYYDKLLATYRDSGSSEGGAPAQPVAA